MELREALLMLDVQNDEHWTNDDQPALQPLTDLMGDKVTRQAVNQIARGFTRVNRAFPNTITERTGDDEDLRADRAAGVKLVSEIMGDPNKPIVDDDDSAETDPSGEYNAAKLAPQLIEHGRDDCDEWRNEVTRIAERLAETQRMIDAINEENKPLLARKVQLEKMIAENESRAVYQDDVRAFLRQTHGENA